MDGSPDLTDQAPEAGESRSLPEVTHWDPRQWDHNQDGLTLPLKVLPGRRDGQC